MNEQQLQDRLYRFGGGTADSTMTWGTSVLVVTAILLMFLLPRKYLIYLFLAVSIFIPYSQIIVLAGLHFNIYRVLLPFAWVRALTAKHPEGEEPFRLNGLDKAIMLWVVTDAICDTLLWMNWGAVVNRVGSLYNVFGIYFLLRLLIRDREDVYRVVRTLAAICAVLAVFMVLEQINGRNVFSVFGGVSEFTSIREGKIRSQAAFAHAIVAGTVGATLVPLFIQLWREKNKSRKLAGLGVVAGVVMTITSSSATPLFSLFAGIGALLMWPFRHSMRLFRWAAVIGLVGLNMVMKAPVWALIGRVSIIGGNSSWHRYELINEAILHFKDWWLFGAKNPGSWGWEMGDISNAYVNAAASGGLLAFIFFLAIFWQAFRLIGLARKKAEVDEDRKTELMVWAFGATLFSTAVSYFGIWYFDQSILIWYALLAMIGAITATALAQAPATEPQQQLPPWARKPSLLPVTSPAGAQTTKPAVRVGPPGFANARARLADLYGKR